MLLLLLVLPPMLQVPNDSGRHGHVHQRPLLILPMQVRTAARRRAHTLSRIVCACRRRGGGGGGGGRGGLALLCGMFSNIPPVPVRKAASLVRQVGLCGNGGLRALAGGWGLGGGCCACVWRHFQHLRDAMSAKCTSRVSRSMQCLRTPVTAEACA